MEYRDGKLAVFNPEDAMVEPDGLAMAAVCGLWCGACFLHQAGEEGGATLEAWAKRMGQTPEETRCQGCRSADVSAHCRTCDFRACATERGLAFCSICPDFPCEKLVTFQAERPHRLDLWRDGALIREMGGEAWLAEIPARYACPSCGRINHAYNLSCPGCGHVPANAYSAEHGDAVKDFLALR